MCSWSTKKKWTLDLALIEAKKYVRRSDFQKASLAAYRLVRKSGLLDTVFKEKRINYPTKWTIETVKIEASKFQSRSEFAKGSGSAYNAAIKYKLLADLFGFVRNQWNDESMREEMLKYESRQEFYRSNSSAHCTALRKFQHLIDELLPLCTDRNNCDNDTVYVWKAVDQLFNGVPVYKIGITSARLTNTRLNQVSASLGFKSEVVCVMKVKGKATDVEKKILKLGVSPKYSGFNGYSEFRAFTDTDLNKALNIITKAANV